MSKAEMADYEEIIESHGELLEDLEESGENPAVREFARTILENGG